MRRRRCGDGLCTNMIISEQTCGIAVQRSTARRGNVVRGEGGLGVPWQIVARRPWFQSSKPGTSTLGTSGDVDPDETRTVGLSFVRKPGSMVADDGLASLHPPPPQASEKKRQDSKSGQICGQMCPDLLQGWQDNGAGVARACPVTPGGLGRDLGRSGQILSCTRSVRGRSAQILDPIWGRSGHILQ
eukprot:gene11280-biopygen10894